jgi:hypothetical protein
MGNGKYQDEEERVAFSEGNYGGEGKMSAVRLNLF